MPCAQIFGTLCFSLSSQVCPSSKTWPNRPTSAHRFPHLRARPATQVNGPLPVVAAAPHVAARRGGALGPSRPDAAMLT